MASYGADGKLMDKMLSKYDDKGNRIEWAEYGAYGKLRDKHLSKYKYDDQGNQIELAWYIVKEKFGKAQEVPESQINWEYEFYPEPEK